MRYFLTILAALSFLSMGAVSSSCDHASGEHHDMEMAQDMASSDHCAGKRLGGDDGPKGSKDPLPPLPNCPICTQKVCETITQVHGLRINVFAADQELQAEAFKSARSSITVPEVDQDCPICNTQVLSFYTRVVQPKFTLNIPVQLSTFLC